MDEKREVPGLFWTKLMQAPLPPGNTAPAQSPIEIINKMKKKRSEKEREKRKKEGKDKEEKRCIPQKVLSMMIL